jgi:hypothetical protein
LRVSRLTDDQIARLAADGRLQQVERGAIVPLDTPAIAIDAGAWFRWPRRRGGRLKGLVIAGRPALEALLP